VFPIAFLCALRVCRYLRGSSWGARWQVKRLEGGGGRARLSTRTEVEVLSRHAPPKHRATDGPLPGAALFQCTSSCRGNLQKALAGASRPLKWFDRVRVLVQLVDALLFLHHHEPPIVHRDLNPENILLASGVVKLADVGLARLLPRGRHCDRRTQGHPGYIDPAEVMSCEVSVLGDVYALGLVGLQLLMGNPPFSASRRHSWRRPTAAAAVAKSGRSNSVMDRLDITAGDWPSPLTRDLALVLLRCADHSRPRRPDLAEEVQPLLRRAAERADAESQRQADGLELQLICPLAKVRSTVRTVRTVWTVCAVRTGTHSTYSIHSTYSTYDELKL